MTGTTAFTLTVDTAKATATIELARPETGNKLSAPEVAELGRTIRAAGGRKDIKVVVVRAQGDAFCLGRAPGSGPAPANALAIRTEVADPILSLYADVRATEVPVVRQFMSGLPDGPMPFHVPAPDYREQLLGKG